MGLGILTDGGHAGTGSGYLSVGSQSVLKMLFGGSLHHRLLLIDFENSADVRKVLVTPYISHADLVYTQSVPGNTCHSSLHFHCLVLF